MGFLDSVKGKLRRGDDEWDDRYDDYDDEPYDDYDDYDDEPYDDYDRPARRERPARRSSYNDGFSGSSRRESRLNEATPLVSNADVRSQSYERSSSNSIGVPDYSSGLSNYAITTRGGQPVSGSYSSTTERSDDAIVAARAELEALKQGIHVPYNSIDPQPAQSAQPQAAAPQPQPASPISPLAISRNMVTMTPTSYADAEKIATALKGGSSVVVSLSSIRPELAKRILDFSFGAVSVLDGSASKIGKNVFYLSRTGAPITEAELSSLRGAGII